ncbi:hypothetical protein [Roseateles sp.]|uniref:hypothetical protein n=1 Tax=Roseateles sp. TaxID=1971397 RepID=UPI003BA6F9B9
MTMSTLRPDEKGYVFDHSRLVLCKVGSLEFSHRFKDMLVHAVLRDGSGHHEEVHLMFAAADVEALASFLATCRDRSIEIVDPISPDVAPDSVASNAEDEVGPGRT